jgi:predicted nucleic acid-binding protein
MLIVDASCLYAVLADGTKAEIARARMRSDPDLAAPHLVDAEVLGVIRRDLMLGRIDPTAAHQAVEDLRDWPGERFGHRLLLGRAWELRGQLRMWDAIYVALAEALDATLLTFDERLARTAASTCAVEVPGRY